MLLVALAPLFLVVAVLVKLTSPGPVFFRQTRVGLNKRQFSIYKFRTMVANAEQLQDQLLVDERNVRARIQDQERSADHPIGQNPAQNQPRRTSAAVQRLEG